MGQPWEALVFPIPAQALSFIRRGPGPRAALIKVPLHNSPDGDKSPQRLLLKADV